MTQSYVKYAAVIVDVAIDKVLDYGVLPSQETTLKRGMQVEVLIRGQLRKGFVIELKEQTSCAKILPIQSIVNDQEIIVADLFDLALWMAKYYHAPLRQVFKSILPAPIRHTQGHKEQLFVTRAQVRENLRKECIHLQHKHAAQSAILEVMLLAKKGMLLSELLEKAKTSRSPLDTLVKKGLLNLEHLRLDRSPLKGEEYIKTKPKMLNEEQQKILAQVSKNLEARQFATHLLFGVTGSGKTEVYLQAIAQALQMHLGTIMLVPEIALTTQTIERFRSRFDDTIAILHHRLSEGERFDEWHRIRRGEAKIVIGARSALFSPVHNLGLIIVDEEHDAAYKQTEESPCYHARDVAVMRAKLTHSTVILGSATPSLESYYNCQNGKYTLNTLSTRPDAAQMPRVSIIDMRREWEKAQGYTLFSEALIEGIKTRFTRGEQTILFLNRRGYHTSQLCHHCGYIFTCPHCDCSLTYHRTDSLLACHLCGYQLLPLPRCCPQCSNNDMLKFKGIGTEQVEKQLHALFPEIRSLRMDGDTTRHKGSHEQLFRSFSTGKGDILIGTQMVTKGLHFPAVTLVAILNSDPGLQLPDFRASEKAFQIITQVAGRAGRGHLPGEVLLQTHMPYNSVIQWAAQQNFIGFYKQEMESRHLFGYPPYCHLVKLVFSGLDSHLTQASAKQFRQHLSTLLHPHFYPSRFSRRPCQNKRSLSLPVSYSRT